MNPWTVCRRLTDTIGRTWREATALRRTVLLLLVVEAVVAGVLPAVVPRRTYLKLYLNDPRISESVTAFFKGEAVLQPDPAAGWINRPNLSIGNWDTDSFGARRYQSVGVERTDKPRILFLGSSKINGSTGITSSDMISAYLSGPDLETLNLGTMLYGPDQSYAAYMAHYARLNPDLVVLGLDVGADEAMLSMYVPFRSRDEVLMPFVKPRFELVDGQLQKIDPPLELLRRMETEPDRLLEFLEPRDGFFRVFDEFRRFNFTPLSYAADTTLRRINRLSVYARRDPVPEEALLLALLRRFRDELASERKQFLLLLLPDADAVAASRTWESALYRYERLRSLVTAAGLSAVDPRPDLSAQGGITLFHPDGIHYTEQGNKVIAGALANYLKREGVGPMREVFKGNRPRL